MALFRDFGTTFALSVQGGFNSAHDVGELRHANALGIQVMPCDSLCNLEWCFSLHCYSRWSIDYSVDDFNNFVPLLSVSLAPLFNHLALSAWDNR